MYFHVARAVTMGPLVSQRILFLRSALLILSFAWGAPVTGAEPKVRFQFYAGKNYLARSLALSADGSVLGVLLGRDGRTADFWDLKTGTKISSFDKQQVIGDPQSPTDTMELIGKSLQDLKLSADGKSVTIYGASVFDLKNQPEAGVFFSTARVVSSVLDMHVATGKKIERDERLTQSLPRATSVGLSPEMLTPKSLAFTADGKLCAAASTGSKNRPDGDSRIRLWDTVSKKILNEIAIPSCDPSALLFSADGQGLIFAAWSWQNGVQVWDIALP